MAHRVIQGFACPRCRSANAAHPANYGRPQKERLWCLDCGALWTPSAEEWELSKRSTVKGVKSAREGNKEISKMHPNDFVMARIDKIQAKASEQADAAFASDLGLAPGQWPQRLEHAGKDWLRGQQTRNADGELESIEYYRPGARLTVFND